MRIPQMLVQVLSAAALLGGLCAPRAMAVGAESARPSAATPTLPGLPGPRADRQRAVQSVRRAR